MNNPTTNTAQMLESASIGVSATCSSTTAGAGFSGGTLFLDILSPIRRLAPDNDRSLRNWAKRPWNQKAGLDLIRLLIVTVGSPVSISRVRSVLSPTRTEPIFRIMSGKPTGRAKSQKIWACILSPLKGLGGGAGSLRPRCAIRDSG